MIGIRKNIQRFALSLTAAVCIAGIPAMAHGAHKHAYKHGAMHSSATIRKVQLRLRADGFYHGRIDGIAGPSTRVAIRRYQRHNNLASTGRLNRVTLRSLHVRFTPRGEAARSSMIYRRTTSSVSSTPSTPGMPSATGTPNVPATPESSNMPGTSAAPNASGMNPTSSGTANPAPMNLSRATIQAAQNKLKQNGLYTGEVNGIWNSDTESAVRQYQQNNNLTVTGQLDPDTLKSLGVSATQNPPSQQ